jgi:hypothetical protein
MNPQASSWWEGSLDQLVATRSSHLGSKRPPGGVTPFLPNPGGLTTETCGWQIFLCVFSVHTVKLVINISVSKIPTEKYKNPRGSYTIFFVRDNTHREIIITLSA